MSWTNQPGNGGGPPESQQLVCIQLQLLKTSAPICCYNSHDALLLPSPWMSRIQIELDIRSCSADETQIMNLISDQKKRKKVCFIASDSQSFRPCCNLTSTFLLDSLHKPLLIFWFETSLVSNYAIKGSSFGTLEKKRKRSAKPNNLCK